MKGLTVMQDDGATQPFGHGHLIPQWVMPDNTMFKEFHDVIAVELFFIGVDSRCGNLSYAQALAHSVFLLALLFFRRLGPMELGCRTEGAS